jgi:hypothetical protein
MMGMMIDWYKENSKEESIGFFQIAGALLATSRFV